MELIDSHTLTKSSKQETLVSTSVSGAGGHHVTLSRGRAVHHSKDQVSHRPPRGNGIPSVLPGDGQVHCQRISANSGHCLDPSVHCLDSARVSMALRNDCGGKVAVKPVFKTVITVEDGQISQIASHTEDNSKKNERIESLCENQCRQTESSLRCKSMYVNYWEINKNIDPSSKIIYNKYNNSDQVQVRRKVYDMPSVTNYSSNNNRRNTISYGEINVAEVCESEFLDNSINDTQLLSLPSYKISEPLQDSVVRKFNCLHLEDDVKDRISNNTEKIVLDGDCGSASAVGLGSGGNSSNCYTVRQLVERHDSSSSDYSSTSNTSSCSYPSVDVDGRQAKDSGTEKIASAAVGKQNSLWQGSFSSADSDYCSSSSSDEDHPGSHSNPRKLLCFSRISLEKNYQHTLVPCHKEHNDNPVSNRRHDPENKQNDERQNINTVDDSNTFGLLINSECTGEKTANVIKESETINFAVSTAACGEPLEENGRNQSQKIRNSANLSRDDTASEQSDTVNERKGVDRGASVSVTINSSLTMLTNNDIPLARKRDDVASGLICSSALHSDTAAYFSKSCNDKCQLDAEPAPDCSIFDTCPSLEESSEASDCVPPLGRPGKLRRVISRRRSRRLPIRGARPVKRQRGKVRLGRGQ